MSVWGIPAKDLIELIQKEYEENEIIGFNIYGKSDVETELDCKITDDEWDLFLKTFVTDDNLNEIRASAWMDALDVVRDEVDNRPNEALDYVEEIHLMGLDKDHA